MRKTIRAGQPGPEGKGKTHDDDDTDQTSRTEQDPAASSDQKRHAAEQQHRLRHVAQLVPPLLLGIEWRQGAAGSGGVEEQHQGPYPIERQS